MLINILTLGTMIQSAIAADLPSHESIWTSGFTVDKGRIVLEGGVKTTTVKFSDNGDEQRTFTNLEIPTLHLRYGLLNSTELFSSVTTTTLGVGIKQELLPIDGIPFSLQARTGLFSEVGDSTQGIFGGIGGEILLPFIQSSIEIVGTGSDLRNENTKYTVWFETGNQIPLFILGDSTKTNLVVHYTHPISALNEPVENQIINDGGGFNTTYVLHSSIQAGMSVFISDVWTIYGLFSTIESFGTMIATSQSEFMVLPPWAQTKDMYDIDANRGFNLTVSYQF